MSQIIFKNNAQSSLAGGISPTATSAQLQAGTGVLFAQPTPGQFFVGTFVDAATGLSNEIIHVTQVVGDTISMVRAQEGTAARSWEPGDAFSELWTAGQAGAMLQQGDEQSGASTFGIDTGVANAYSTTLTPALTVLTMGETLRFKAANSNTGPSTINFGTGAAPLVNAQGLPLSGGEIIAGYVYECYWNGANFNLAMPSLVNIPTGLLTPYAGGSVPTGWLACIGQAVGRTVYPALFAVIGTVYGGGDGTTTFNLPDTRGRVVAGLDGGQNRLTNATMTPNGNTLGATGGQQTEAASVSVSGTVSVGGGTSGSLSVNVSGTSSGPSAPFQSIVDGTGSGVASSGHTHNENLGGGTSGSLSVSANGGNSMSGATAAVTNVQPTLIASYMIKT
jgi:microcystin-dependent protein